LTDANPCRIKASQAKFLKGDCAMIKLVKLALVCIVLGPLGFSVVQAKEPTPPNPNAVINKIVPVDGNFAGKTYSQLVEAWFQWAALQSAENDAIADPDGRFAAVGQGGKFWFLAGTYGGSVVRQATIPPGKAIFFPIVNVWAIGNDPTPVTPDVYWPIIDTYIEGTAEMNCVIDGIPIKNLEQFFARSRGYPDSWSTDYTFYSAPGDPPVIYPAILEGYWILLQPLSAGKHTIHFSGRTVIPEWAVDFSIDATYHITVEN
jgi:hypothetical protein